MDDALKEELNVIFKKYLEVSKVVLFGSRARGDNEKNSDVDICLFGDKITHSILAQINMDIYEINTPLSFDIVCFKELEKKSLIENIKKEGVVLYSE